MKSKSVARRERQNKFVAKVLWHGKSVTCEACGYNARIFHFAVCPKCKEQVPHRNNKMHKYKIMFDLEMTVGEFTAKEIGKRSGTDALVVGSVLFPEGGKPNIKFSSFDGRSSAAPLSDADLFKVMAQLAKDLSQSSTLNSMEKEYAKIISDVIASKIDIEKDNVENIK